VKNFLVILVFAAIFSMLLFVYNKEYATTIHYALNATVKGSALPKKPLQKAVHMAINPSIELDYKSKAEIYEIRKKYVNQYPELAPKYYKPSEAVFGQIVNGKPWLGEVGASINGFGLKVIEGMSEEARYLVNPYLLVAVDSMYMFSCDRHFARNTLAYPIALEMFWESRTVVHAYFDVSTFIDRTIRCNYNSSQLDKLFLIAYNARDFGYNYLGVDLAQSENILHFGATGTPAHIKQFIHLGDNCGHYSGCNNMSPAQPELFMPYTKLPAKAHVKLWKKKPRSINDTADFTFVIYMM